MRIVQILKGLPRSGKSSYAVNFIKQQQPNTWIRINRDDIRSMLTGVWSKGYESFVHEMENDFIYNGLANGYNLIIDNTHLNPTRVEEIKYIVSATNRYFKKPITVEEKIFDISLEECLLRNNNRAKHRSDAYVPEDVIINMYHRWKDVHTWLRES